MKKLLIAFILSLLQQVVLCQDLRIYHGEKSESVFLKEFDKLENSSKESVKIVRKVSGIVTIHILNPNPFFYNYEIKTEDVEIKDDYSDQFAELVKLVNLLPDLAKTKDHDVRLAPLDTEFGKYQKSLEILGDDIKMAKGHIEKSDHPETIEEAFKRVSNSDGYGFRGAIAKIQKLESSVARFNSKSLEKDLNDLLDAAVADSDSSFEKTLRIGADVKLKEINKSAYKSLNNQLVTTVNEILKITEKDRVLRFQIPVKENKQTKIRLVITKIKDSDKIARELLNEEIATVTPLYVRKTFEVVPVVNLIFQSNQVSYSIENNLVKESPDDDAKFNVGAMALMNFASFGDYKEFGVGLGIGYSMQPEGNSSSFFAIPSLSYKSIFRFGFGFGYNLASVGLKNGAEVGSPLPANISNIEDVVDYKRKPAAVLTIAISGFKF